jgi:aminoacrylate hydrolase
MHFDIQGNGHPVVLMAGLGGLGAFWQPVMERLSSGYMCITFDHPGMGRSPPSKVHTIEHIASEVLGLLDQLGLGSAHFVGHSTGGLVAQVLALDHAARVDRIVLSATWARPDRRFRDLFETRRMVLERAGFAAYNAIGKLLGYPADWYEARLASDAPINFDATTDGDLATAVARIQMLLDFDRAVELDSIRAPVLIVGASDDAIVPISHSHDLARRLPQARMIELQGGHFLPQTQTERYVAALDAHFVGQS